MSLTDTIFGTPGSTTYVQSPGAKPPGYNQARQIFNWMMQTANNPYPSYQGRVDPGLSPTMQDLIRRSQGYASAGAPEILSGVQGTLGRFMNTNFMNPLQRIFGGASDYSGAGGGSWNRQFAFSPFQRGFDNPGWSGQNSPYGGQSGGGQGYFPQYQSSAPTNYMMAPTPPMPNPADRQTGAKPFWDMGAGANRGQIRQGSNGPEILVGAGGGEQYQWVPYTGDYGQQQNANMFNRYGSNWTAGSGTSGGHSSDVKYWLQNAWGRNPTQNEVNDHYYGVRDVAPMREQAARDNARYNPASSQYDPNSQNELVNLWRRR